MHIFTRRTPRALHFLVSSTKPLLVRKGNRTTIHWQSASCPEASTVAALLRRLTDPKTLTPDWATAAAMSLPGYTLTYHPRSAAYAERLTLTKED